MKMMGGMPGVRRPTKHRALSRYLRGGDATGFRHTFGPCIGPVAVGSAETPPWFLSLTVGDGTTPIKAATPSRSAFALRSTRLSNKGIGQMGPSIADAPFGYAACKSCFGTERDRPDDARRLAPVDQETVPDGRAGCPNAAQPELKKTVSKSFLGPAGGNGKRPVTGKPHLATGLAELTLSSD
jgi:hypothetical protein